jgi:hypothetical protein
MKNIMRGPVKDPREMPKEKDTKERTESEEETSLAV